MLFVTLIPAQERPPIEVFSTNDYGADIQNWSISQSKDRNIYVANNNGLLEYNGAHWKLYASPNNTIIRSVNVIDDSIYTGCNGEFGFWERNEFGLLFYTSLSKKLGIEFTEEEEFWNIVAIDDFILFQSLKRIYVYNKTSARYDIIESDTIIYKIFKVGQSIYFQKTNDGIYKIENGKSKLVTNDEVIKNNRLTNIFDQDGGLLIETENKGFFRLKNNVFSRWDISANKLLSQVSVFRSIQLRDKSFVLGTRSSGILHLSASGNLDYDIDVVHGLGNNTVHGVFEDLDNNIWLALENGVNCININSPFSIYKDQTGKLGTVYTAKVFNGYLYLGTNQGLFYKNENTNETFKLIDEINEAVWSLVEIDNTLFCGHDTGTSIVTGASVYKINGIQYGTWNIKPIPQHPNLLLQGNYNGLNILEKKAGIWEVRNKIQGFDLSSRFYEFSDNNILVNHEYHGVFKIRVDDNFTKALSVDRNTEISKEINSSITKYKDDLLYASEDGILKYSKESNEFIRDSLLTSLYKKEDYTSGRLIYTKETNTLWIFSKSNLNYLASGELSDIPKINKISLSHLLPKGLLGYENITYIKKQQYLVGTSEGYIIIDLDKLPRKSYSISIDDITKQRIDSQSEILHKEEYGYLENLENNVDFKYSVAEFDKYIDTEYQYKLEGMYPNWSNWSTNASTLFKNLPSGDYVFTVRGRVGNSITENTVTYSFSIDKPWYLTYGMISIYFLAVLLFSIMMHNIYKRYYRKQRERLLKQAQRELEIKDLENKQQFMRFNNDKLRQDIDSKSRELGISTMTLIKKNEFLNALKEELLLAEDKKGINKVVRIIDRNLNNNDDWHVFEEAFNNSDKDFLKKIKSIHPELTSNDLRLCAYLRLNLSSKEIAPLLNISPKSVEVKRYRLRKKMNLKHESSLTDYILEI